jgi:MFS family permease
MSTAQFGMIYSISGVGALLIQVYCVKPILAKLGEFQAGNAAHCSRICAYALILVCHQPWAPYAMGVIIPFGSLISPVAAALLSHFSPTEVRGSILGMNQFFASFGRGLGPMVASILYGLHPDWLWYGSIAWSAIGILAIALCQMINVPPTEDVMIPDIEGSVEDTYDEMRLISRSMSVELPVKTNEEGANPFNKPVTQFLRQHS